MTGTVGPDEEARAGTLAQRLAFFRLGRGRPLVYLPGLSAHHRLPEGTDLLVQQRLVQPLAASREVWWVQRPRGLARGASMADIATEYAEALREEFGEPVDVVGASTGGSTALQLAADHPDVVRRVVLLSAACRLGPLGRSSQRQLADLLERGEQRAAGALLMSLLGTGRPAQRVLGAVGWLLGPVLTGVDTSDAVATIEAEDGFDLTHRLGSIQTPVLVVGGGRDRFYGAALFRQTATGLPHGSLLTNARKGHVGALSSPVALEAAVRFLDEE